MSNREYNRPGIGHVGSYQVSGYPFLQGGIVGDNGEAKIEFPHVTKKVKVKLTDSNPLRVHFVTTASAGNVLSGAHYWLLETEDEEVEFGVKCKEVYLSAPSGSGSTSYEVYAECTHIGIHEMYALTGSGITE